MLRNDGRDEKDIEIVCSPELCICYLSMTDIKKTLESERNSLSSNTTLAYCETLKKLPNISHR